MGDFIGTHLAWLTFGVFVVIGVIIALSYRTRLITYVGDVRQEWTRVSTPSREEAIGHTWVVILAVAITAGYLFVVDWGLGRVTRLFYGL
ncbi:MAG: preprotein translocase subunit SecE [Candidatus Poribacteria bacterium]